MTAYGPAYQLSTAIGKSGIVAIHYCDETDPVFWPAESQMKNADGRKFFNHWWNAGEWEYLPQETPA